MLASARIGGEICHAEMNANRSTVTLHVVSSLDGFIANKDNTVSWLEGSGDVYERGVFLS
jgi:hypothetical protein